MNNQYPVNEIFQSIQGEGYFTGVPAIFVRLQGCPVGCAWCDTQHTWELAADKQVARIVCWGVPAVQPAGAA